MRYVPVVPSPATPGSPSSEMSAPLSSLAVSIPSVALSPSVEDERPLLLSNTQQHQIINHNQKRTSAHYNHGHDAHSLPSSPLLFREHNNYNSTGEHDPTAARHMELPERLLKTNNNIYEYNMKGTTVANGHVLFSADSGDGILESETEETQGGNLFFINGDMSTALLLRARTTPASPNDTPHVLSCNTTIKPDPVAV